jgi:DNA-binding LacI/PurR family transcriptional regulator
MLNFERSKRKSKMSKRATIRDVADAAGVSKSLAAMVFASEEGVSPERRERVLAAAKELGYRPNQWARSLRSGTGNMVSIIVADLHNPLFTEAADMVRQNLAQQGVYCVVAAAAYIEQNGKKKLDPVLTQNLLDLKPRGLLVVGGLPDYTPLTKANIPIVLAFTGAGDLPSAVSVRGDDHESMRVLLDHLTSLGHQKIAYIGPSDTYVATFRREAYIDAMKKRNLEGETSLFEGERSESGGYSAAQQAIASKKKPTAIICYNDNVAFGVLDAVDQHTAGGGESIAVTGYDNTYIAQLGKVSLTSIEQDKLVVAEKVCELLLQSDEYKKFKGKEILMFPRLYVRNSTLTKISNS